MVDLGTAKAPKGRMMQMDKVDIPVRIYTKKELAIIKDKIMESDEKNSLEEEDLKVFDNHCNINNFHTHIEHQGNTVINMTDVPSRLADIGRVQEKLENILDMQIMKEPKDDLKQLKDTLLECWGIITGKE
jgi:hypothetical protein